MVLRRRVVLALVLGAITFSVLVAGTGAALADREPGALEGTFAVAPSQPGDRVVYSLALIVRMDERQGIYVDAGARMEMERLPDRLLPLDGTASEPLASYATTWATEDIDWSMGWSQWAAEQAQGDWDGGWGSDGDWEGYGDPSQYGAGRENAAMASAWAWTAGFGRLVVGDPWQVEHADAAGQAVATTRVAAGDDDAGLPGRALADAFGAAPDMRLLTLAGPAPLPCGYASALQLGPQPLSQPVEVLGRCPPPGALLAGDARELPSPRFLASGHDRVGGREAVVFGHESSAEALRLWYAADVPYPVRMLAPLSASGLDVPRMHLLYEMTSFEPGALPAAGSGPGVDSAPRLPEGPDAAGVDHPFPLAAALLAAREDVLDPAVRDWLAAHPDAAIDTAGYAQLRDGTDGANVRHQWSFTLTDGRDALAVTVTKGPPEPVATLPIPLGALPTDDGVDVASTEVPADGRPTPLQMPATAPRVASLLEAWQRDGGSGGDPAWAFRFGADGGHWVAAGHATATGTGGDGQGQQDGAAPTVAYAFLGTDAAGRFLFLEESPGRYDPPREATPDDIGPWWDPSSRDRDARDPASFALASVGFWTFPEAETAATISVAAILVGALGAILWPAKWGLPALGLFSRIGHDQVLEHPLRERIVQVIEAEPGIHFQELVRKLDAGRGTMEHHLRKLVDANLVSTNVSQGFTCYFPKGKVDRHLMAAAPVLKSDGARQVLQAIQESPGRAAQDVAGVTGLTPSTVNYHLKRLVASGLVAHERRGRFILLTPTPLGTQALGAWGRPGGA